MASKVNLAEIRADQCSLAAAVVAVPSQATGISPAKSSDAEASWLKMRKDSVASASPHDVERDAKPDGRPFEIGHAITSTCRKWPPDAWPLPHIYGGDIGFKIRPAPSARRGADRRDEPPAPKSNDNKFSRSIGRFLPAPAVPSSHHQ